MEFSKYQLGVDSKVIQLQSWSENRDAAAIMANQCQREIDIISRLLDPFIFNSSDFIDAIKKLITSGKRANIRIIVFDPETIVRNGHQIVRLAGDFSSFFEIRKASNEYKHYNQSLLMVDKTGYLHRLNSTRYEATLNFYDRKKCKALDEEFTEMWESGLADPNLRRMRL